MNLPSYLLAIAVVGSGIFALGPHHLGTSSAAYANSAVRADVVASAAPTSTASGTPATAASAPASSAATVDTKNFAYIPGEISVPVGSTVRFTNSDSVAHTIAAVDGSFDSKNMSEGASWSHVFEKAGTYAYYCAYHRYMKGTIVVK